MKYTFLIAFLLLAGISLGRYESGVGAERSSTPIYWATDANPARVEQVQLFQRWMATHYQEEPVQLKADATASNDLTKLLIQCVSGVGDDVLDLGGGHDLRYLQQMGVLRDLSPVASRLGIDTANTYPAFIGELCLPPGMTGTPSRQFAFPCNAATSLYFVNRATFKKYGVTPPSGAWSIDQFERVGRAFVSAANPDPAHRAVFFADAVDRSILRRSLGVGTFNETGTRCLLDTPEAVAILQKRYDWTYRDHLLPTLSETQSASTASGLKGSGPQLFNSGAYGMVFSGRYLLVQFRLFDAARAARGEPQLDLGTAEPPSGGFANSDAFTRAAAVYAGSKHQDLALHFLQFLGSDVYNKEIIADGDSLPPNPAYVKDPTFLHPAEHPSEGPLNAAFADAAYTLAISASYSPFVLASVVDDIDGEAESAMLSDRLTPEAAGLESATRINDEIARTLSENPSLRPLYDELVQRQHEIDTRRAAGRKVPAAWLTDPFYLKYYQAHGWVE